MNAPSVPIPWVERLFARLSAIYGNKMTTMWGDCPKADLMDAWCEALGKVNPEHIRGALESVAVAYPEWPPTLGQFLLLCRPSSSDASHRRLLPSPKGAGPSTVVAKEISVLIDSWGKKKDPKRWAREILAEAAAGVYRLPIGILFAYEALANEKRAAEPRDREEEDERAAIQEES